MKKLIVLEEDDGSIQLSVEGGMLWAMGAAEWAQRLLTLKLFEDNKKQKQFESEVSLATPATPDT